ncbi:MAG: ATP-binding cassette domain-containing protein, partial [Cyclobacteriaceae bacterium]|nr:ATP-binding cassette domain-containing protein [Cyclobacteriaceae bacterium]
MFAIVAKERITDAERNNISEFLSVHLNQESRITYLKLFDSYASDYHVEEKPYIKNIDTDTLAFVDEWKNIIEISHEVNKALTIPQKLVLLVKIIELVFADGEISERQGNLIFYIAEALKISHKTLNRLKLFVTGQDIEELSSKNILIIDEGSDDYITKGPRIQAKNITGLIAILRIPDTETYFIKYLGISALYLNGIPIKSRKIDVFPTGSSIRGNKIETIYFSDIVSKFLIDKETAQITFTVEHLFYHFKSGRAGLQNINIAEEGGKLIGLMGSSGSGKSTLLSVLNGMEEPSSGRVIVNGINIHENKEEIEGLFGFVPQDDLLIEELTVFENLYYASKLSLSDKSEKELSELINGLLINLGLSETADLKVGSPLDKTISGGQRKRLNIGLELLREPSILFVDEPTSGLSSNDSENIMDLLKELSLRGKMIFVVIHQPSSSIFKMFDKLIILDIGGFQIYCGNPVDAVLYFKDIVNAANKTLSTCPECGNINSEQIFNIIETKVVNEFGRLTPVRKISPGQWYQYFREKIVIPKIHHAKDKLETLQNIPTKFNQFKIFVQRDVKSKIANKQYMAINLLEAPVLAFFMAFMVRYHATVEVNSPAYSFFENDNIPVYFFMSIIVSLFMGLTVSAEEIFRDRKILRREKFLNLSRGSYLFSKVGVLFTISAIQTASYVIIGDSILQIEGMEPRFWLILFSVSCFANILGLNISSAFYSAVTIYILIPILLIPQLLLSGVVINFDKFNPKVSTMEGVPLVGETMASRWAFEAAMVTQYKDNPFEKQFYQLDRKIANAGYKKIYYIPRLETELSFCINNFTKRYTSENESISLSLELLKYEIQKELNHFPNYTFDKLELLTVNEFDTSVYNYTSKFIQYIKSYYSINYSKFQKEKDQMIQNMISTSEGKEDYNNQKNKYQNETIINTLRARDLSKRIIKHNDKLIRKVDPIYITETS